MQDLVPCVLLSFEFEHILMWRGSDWKSSLPPLGENNFEVTKVQEHFSGKELNEKVRHSGTILTQIELASDVTNLNLQDCNLGEREDKSKDSMKPKPAGDMVLSSATQVTGSLHSIGMSGTEPSPHTALEHSQALIPVSDFADPSVKSALHCRSIPSEKSGNRGLVELSLDHSAIPEHSPGVLEPHPCTTGMDDKLGTKGKDIVDIKGRDVQNSSCKVPSYMDEVLLLLKQALDSGRALVLSENEFVDPDLVYQKSVAFTKAAPRGPVFEHTQTKYGARRNGQEKYVRVKKHIVGNKVSSSRVEKGEYANGGLAQTNYHAQEFLSDVVPQGTLRVDELAKLLA